MKNICVVIPSLNPDERLFGVVSELFGVGFEKILIVDDGSRAENKVYFPEDDRITRLTHDVNRGKGAALKTALKYVSENMPEIEGIVTCDADGQHTAKDTRRVAEKLAETGKFVLGCRDFSLDNVPFRSKFGNRLTSVALFLCSGNYICDTQTGLRGIPKKSFEAMGKVSGERFEYETNVLLELKQMGLDYCEVKIETVYLNENKSSHFRPVRDSLRIMSLMLKYIASSVIAFAVDMLLFTLLHSTFHFGITLSTALARVCSSVVNFTINKKVVFKSSTSLAKCAVKYALVVVVVMLLSAGGTFLLSTLMRLPDNSYLVTLVKAIVDTVLFVVNFYVQKYWIFKKG